MFAIVIIVLVLALLMIGSGLLLVFLSVGFSDPEHAQREVDAHKVRTAIDLLQDVKVDRANPTSRTFGEIITEQLTQQPSGQKPAA